MKAAIIQSNYLPWKGYFDIIHDVDIFVFLDDVQYTRGDWRNRNKVKTSHGVKWITVPVSGGIHQRICDAKIDYSQDLRKKRNWRVEHANTIRESYESAPFFESYEKELFDVYTQQFITISELNTYFIKKISRLLNIETRFIFSTDLDPQGIKEDRVIDICHKIGADTYISGPAARNYADDNKFKSEKIELRYKEYSGYPPYPQLWGEFEHAVSIIDLLFNCGEKSPEYIWKWREKGK
jgi:hypothetical protein